MNKHKKQFWIANAKAILVLTIVAAVAYSIGMLVGYCFVPPQVIYREIYIESDTTEVMTSEIIQDSSVELVARYELTSEERDIVDRVVMAEAGGEGFDGQRLVAQCILNTAEAQGIRPDEVVLAPNQYAEPAEYASEMVSDAVSAVFDDGNMVTDEPIRWFYAPKYVTSQWHESKKFVLEHGGHRFFKEADQ